MMDFLDDYLDDELCNLADELDELIKHRDILGDGLEWLDSEDDSIEMGS
ncbi:MAG: hypothetical protein NC131_14620 [Roseburia sp.]|nr:hypothetical protein [Roseburia sp.]